MNKLNTSTWYIISKHSFFTISFGCIKKKDYFCSRILTLLYIMVKNNLLKMTIAIALCSMSMISCIKEPASPDIEPEIEVPNNAVDYFQNDINFDFEGGDIIMSFKVNLKWDLKIASTQNGVQWLTIDKVSGNSGNNKVTFTAQENPTYEDRSVVVQFIAGNTTRNIRVNQKRLEAITLTSDEFEIPADGGYVGVEVNHSADYDITIPENYKSWIHITPNSTRGLLDKSYVLFTIDPSEEYEKREGKIYFTARDEEEVVTIYQAGEGKIVLSQSEYNLTGGEQEFSVDISSNFDFGIAMPEVDWLQENKSQTRGMSSHHLSFKVTKNDDYNTRSAKIKFFDNNNKKLSEEITINQASIGAIITLDSTTYTISSDKQNLDIDVKSNFDYDVDLQGTTWINQRAKTRGVSSRLLKLSVEKNDSLDSRTAKIKLYDKNSSASEEITIIQRAKTVIEIPTTSFTVDELGGTVKVVVNSNVAYKTTINDDWIKETSKTRGLETHEHIFTIDPLDGNTGREGSITISNDELKFSKTITIKQNNTFYFGTTDISILIGKEQKLSLINHTNIENIEWSSSDPSVITVNNNGTIKGISKGTATVTAKTADGKHSATCPIKVFHIKDLINVFNIGGSVAVVDNVVQNGSKLKWTFSNDSPDKVTLKSLQLIDGQTNEAGNEMNVNKEVNAETSVDYTITIGVAGIHLPVTCRFRFEYNGVEYFKDAVYKGTTN